MHDTAFHLERNVLPRVPYRQWVITFPRRIRYLMASDRKVITCILSIFIRTLFAYQRRQAKKDGFDNVLPGAITFVQTFGSALNLNFHFHTLLMDGVFIDTPVEEPVTFLELPFVSQSEVETLLVKIATRVMRFVDSSSDEYIDDETDSALSSAQQRALVGPSNRQRALSDSDQACSEQKPYRCASAGGFSLHANVYLQAKDRKGLMRLIRYGARQSFGQDRLSQLPDGRIRYQLARPWGNARAITLEPTALLHRLAALMAAPYLNLTRYHGCFSPNARRRCEVINLAFRANAQRRRSVNNDNSSGQNQLEMPPLPEPIRTIPWADLLARTFKLDVLNCPNCHGRLSVIAFITDLVIVRKILEHLKLPTTLVPPAPSRLDEQLLLDLDDNEPTQYDAALMQSSCRDPP
jgi:hypothetical protein